MSLGHGRFPRDRWNGLGSYRSIARGQEESWTIEFVHRWDNLDSEEIEPIRGRWPVSLSERLAKLPQGVPGRLWPTRDRAAGILPTYALVRASHDTYRIEHTPTGRMVVSPLPFAKARVALARIRDWMGLLQEMTE